MVPGDDVRGREVRAGVLSPAGVHHLALLRGVNVGGKNAVRMAELRAEFEGLGFGEVATYINSGNVLFTAPRQKRDELVARIEDHLTEIFGWDLKVVLLTARQLAGVIESAPRGFGAPTDRCDVLFLRKPLTVKRALAEAETKEGVDRVWAGPGVLYFSRLDARASSSRLSKLAGKPVYKQMTVRSWSTTTKLGSLMEARR